MLKHKKTYFDQSSICYKNFSLDTVENTDTDTVENHVYTTIRFVRCQTASFALPQTNCLFTPH